MIRLEGDVLQQRGFVVKTIDGNIQISVAIEVQDGGASRHVG